MSNEQKLIFLRTVLKGQALALIASATRFEHAWSLLTAQFYEPDAIIENAINSLVNHDPLTNQKQILKYIDALRFRLQELDTLNVKFQPGDMGDRLLSYHLRNSLPAYINQEIARRIKSSYASTAQILSVIDEIMIMFKPVKKAASQHQRGESNAPKPVVQATVKSVDLCLS